MNADSRSSTVAHFVTGWTNAEGEEVLIWHGTEEEDGSIYIEGYDGDEDYKFVIESLQGTEKDDTASDVVNERYAKSLLDAKMQALRAISKDFN